MRPTLTWKSSRVTRPDGNKSLRVVMEAEIGSRAATLEGPLAPDGFDAVRRQIGAVRLSPADQHRKTPPRRQYAASELASARLMMDKLHRGEDLRPEKVASIRASLQHEDFEAAFKMEIAIDRLLEDLER